MPAFKLGDQFGFSLDVVPDPQSGIAKYFQQAVDVVTHGFALTRVAGLDLRDPAVTAFQTGLTFSQPIGIEVVGVRFSPPRPDAVSPHAPLRRSVCTAQRSSFS